MKSLLLQGGRDWNRQSGDFTVKTSAWPHPDPPLFHHTSLLLPLPSQRAFRPPLGLKFGWWRYGFWFKKSNQSCNIHLPLTQSLGFEPQERPATANGDGIQWEQNLTFYLNNESGLNTKQLGLETPKTTPKTTSGGGILHRWSPRDEASKRWWSGVKRGWKILETWLKWRFIAGMTWKWPIFQPCLITRGEAHDLTGQVLWVTKMAWFTPRNKISCLLFSGRRVLRGPSDASLFSIEIMRQPGIAELDFIFIYVPLIWNISSQSDWVSTLMPMKHVWKPQIDWSCLTFLPLNIQILGRGQGQDFDNGPETTEQIGADHFDTIFDSDSLEFRCSAGDFCLKNF